MGIIDYQPCDPLQPYVERFVISEAAAESVYKVLPGTGVVMGFQFRGRLYHVVDGNAVALSQSGVTGISDSYKCFKNSDGTGTVLVCFKDGGASFFFRNPIHELFQNSVSLENFVLRSELLIFEEQLCEAATHAQRIKVVEQFLLSRMKPSKPDLIVAKALDHIYKSHGDIRITDLSRTMNISQSPLEKRFRNVVGTSPKKFASIVRFKHIIREADEQRSLTALGYDAGFYDQSHFIKEFKKFTGDTPDKYFNGK